MASARAVPQHLDMNREDADLKEAFKMLDRDGDGELSPTDVRKSMSMLGRQVSVDEAQDFIEHVSCGDSSLHEKDFLQWMKQTSEEKADDTLENAFRAFDRDGDGFISRDELKVGMTLLGQHMSDDVLDLMMAEADTDHDGKLNFQDFVQIMSR